MNYYVQEIACNYLKNISPEPKAVKVHPTFLYGVDKDDFLDGFLALNRLVKELYAAVVEDPADFGMLLKENTEYNAKNTDYTNSAASFMRVPNLLLLLGTLGELQSDHTLILTGKKLLASAKELKITGLPLLLSKLGAYGLITEGYSKTLKETDLLRVSCPDSPFLTVSLKAMAQAMLTLNKGDLKKAKNYFYMLHEGLLEKEEVKAPKLTVDHIYNALDSEKKEVAKALNEMVSSTCKYAIRMGGFSRNDWSCVYTDTKSKKVLMSLQVEQEKLTAKLNLQNIAKYMEKVMTFPQSILHTMKTSGWECGACREGCSGGFAFEMEGKAYNKCRCGSFLFPEISAKELSYYKEMLDLERSVEVL